MKPFDRDARIQAWEARTFAFLAERGFDPSHADLLLAVSGGADSTALLEFWARSGAPRFSCRLRAVHVHHGLRAAADLDQALVEDRCRALEVPLDVFRLDPGSRRSGESVEMWARRERYRCFRQAAAAAAAVGRPTAFILTAHHRDDLVETVFQRLGRGTGARGLGGIPFRRAPGIVRPFLDRSRAEILDYLALRGAPWREDESNADLGILRNWYRHRYLPPVRAAEPGLDARILRMALSVQSIGDGLLRLEEDAGLLQLDPQGRASLPAAALEARLEERDSQSLKHWLGRLAAASGPVSRTPPVTEEILREWHRQWSSGTRRLRVPVASGAWLERRKNVYYWEYSGVPEGRAVGRGNGPEKECSRDTQKVILDLGQGSAAWRWGDRLYDMTVRTYPRPASLRFPGPDEGLAIFDAALFSCTLQVRTRKDGDRFSPLGIRSGSRKLKVFLNEQKIPAGIRDSLPLVFATPPDRAGETLAWVPGYGISEYYKVGEKTSTILEMELTCRNP